MHSNLSSDISIQPESLEQSGSYSDASQPMINSRPKSRKSWKDLLTFHPVKLPRDVSTRLTDGLIPALLLLALTLMMAMLIQPIQAAADRQGLLIYLFLVLAMGVFALEKCTHPRGIEAGQVISGMVAGQFFWTSLYLIQLLGGIKLEAQGTLLILLLVSLVGATLWKPVLPLGVKFFLAAFLASWANRFLINETVIQSSGIDLYTAFFYASGFFALVGLIFCLAYLIFRAEFKVQRLWAALGIWQTALVSIIVLLKVFL